MLPEMFRALTEKPETLSSGEKGISPFQADRKSVVQGKSVDLGGRRIIKKKKKEKK